MGNGCKIQYIYITPKRLIGVERAKKKKKKAFLLLPATAYGKGATLLGVLVLGAMTLHL